MAIDDAVLNEIGGEKGTRLKRWQCLTVGLVVVGYAGYYLCRSNLSATMPAIAEDLVARGMNPGDVKDRLGWAVSLGTVGYALGKFAAGSLTDLLGGRRNYLIGMAGAVACTLLLPLSGSLPVFSLIWFGNRLIQSLGWPGMIKITSRWISHANYGVVMGVISLSFLFGDAAARAFIGWLINAGLGWRSIFWVAGGILGVLLVVNVALIRESPKELGLPEPETNPRNLFGALGEDPHPDRAGPLLATLARSPAFWIVCLLSLGLTLLRESFNNWTPMYLVEGVGLSKGAAARMSGLFPFFGGISVILAGILGDRFGRAARAAIILGGILLCGLALWLLGSTSFAGRSREALVLVAAVAFLLIGPYSYLAGAISLDFGGKRGGATACGIIDGVGYLFGGVVAGKVVASLSHTMGWQGVFKMLTAVAFLTGLVAAIFLANQLRLAAPAAELPLKIGGPVIDGERAEGDAAR
jgi:OPA family glycerol-3-phosphate transporter-like MFS transporter